MESMVEKYAFRIPLMFEGDRGSGKTYEARQFAEEHGYPCLEIAGNESTEAFEFLGHVVQTEQGMVWKDGKLSQAFRLAAKGQKAVLILDELLRIPQRHLSVLLSALSKDSQGYYRLQTGRMCKVEDGIGVEEEIRAPAGNLCVVATTNVGPEFAVEDLDPAVAERFIIARKDTEPSKLNKILAGLCERKGFSRMVGMACVELYEKTNRMVKTGTLNRQATTRTLARSIEEARSEAEVAEILKDQVLLWADRDSSGYPVQSQVGTLNKAIDELFGALSAPVQSAQAEKSQAAKEARKDRALADEIEEAFGSEAEAERGARASGAQPAGRKQEAKKVWPESALRPGASGSVSDPSRGGAGKKGQERGQIGAQEILDELKNLEIIKAQPALKIALALAESLGAGEQAAWIRRLQAGESEAKGEWMAGMDKMAGFELSASNYSMLASAGAGSLSHGEAAALFEELSQLRVLGSKRASGKAPNVPAVNVAYAWIGLERILSMDGPKSKRAVKF